jgi:DNA-binding CsgD family transcriptional regulator
MVTAGMEGPYRARAEAVLAFLGELAEVRELAEFPKRATIGLAKLVPADLIVYTEVDLTSEKASAYVDQKASLDLRRFAELAWQHPVISYTAQTGDTAPRAISDFLSGPEFHRLELYQDFFKASGIQDQLSVGVNADGPRLIGIAFNRHRRGFGTAERETLRLVRPLLARLYHDLAWRTRVERLLTWLSSDGFDRPHSHRAAKRLTVRELEVVALVGHGFTNKEIGARLDVSARTVQKHLEHVYDKIGVRTRAGAAASLQPRVSGRN